MTIANRVESKMYVSLWYITGTLIWMPLLYFIGNVMWNPPTGALTGINDTIFNWFYGHNVLGLWFTTGLLAVIYYIVPRETHTPLYSHFLSLIAFWGIVFFYTGVGAHHLLWAPIPYWLKTIAVADSIGMILPVVAFMMNIFLTMRGNWNRFFSSIPLRFIITGWAAYILVSYPGLAPGAAQHQPADPLHPVRARPRPSRPAVLRRLRRHGRHVLRDPAHLQQQHLQPEPGQHPVQPVRRRVHLLLRRLPADRAGAGIGLAASGPAGLERAAGPASVHGHAGHRRSAARDQLHHLHATTSLPR